MSNGSWGRCRAVILLCLLVVSLVVGTIPVGVGVASASTGAAADTATQNTDTKWGGTKNNTTVSKTTSPELHVTYRINRTPHDPETVRVEYTARLPENVDIFQINLDRLGAPYTVESTSPAVSYDASTGLVEATKPIGEVRTVSMNYTVESNTTSSLTSETETVETPNWALLDPGQLRAAHRWRYRDTSPRFVDTHTVDGEGYASDGFAFLGAAAVHTREATDQTFTLVVPDAATSSVDAATALDALANASADFDVGDRDPTVTAFVAPDPIRQGGLASGAAFWVHESATLSVGSVWYHEYTHTRQAWVNQNASLRIGDDVEWFTEASADYYGGFISWQTGDDTADSFREYVATDRYAETVLQDTGRNRKELKNYFKGRRVLAALDMRLHRQTDGDVTLADLLARINLFSNTTLRYADLRSEVVVETNESTGEWLDTHVQTSAVPEIPTDIEAAYGLETASERPLRINLSSSSIPTGEPTNLSVMIADQTGSPVENATVEVPALAESKRTNTSGVAVFKLNLTAGEYVVSARATGYVNNTTTVSVVDTSPVDVGPEIIDGIPSIDTDGDGFVDDLNGNSEIDRGDAQALFNARDSVPSESTNLFDYNGNGEVDRGDVQALFQRALRQ